VTPGSFQSLFISGLVSETEFKVIAFPLFHERASDFQLLSETSKEFQNKQTLNPQMTSHCAKNYVMHYANFYF
jgi:hypothetical protein